MKWRGAVTKAKNKPYSIPYSRRELFDFRRPQKFEGAALKEVAFPLGGIGTGTVSLGGRGHLRDWEIFNRPGKGRALPYSFFAIWAKARGGRPVCKVLEGPLQPSYTGGGGIPRVKLAGLPRMAGARFTGEYPFAKVDFLDRDVPLRVSLVAFNPFIPLNAKDSGLPVAILLFSLANPGKSVVRATLVGSLLNAAGYDGKRFLGGLSSPDFGGNLNELLREDKVVGLRMTSSKYKRRDPRFGSMAFTTTHKKITYLTDWARGGKWINLQIIWDDLARDGRLEGDEAREPSPEGHSVVGSLGLRATIKPGEEVVLPFIISWHFPMRINEWNRQVEVRGKPLKNYYAAEFGDAWEVARYVGENFNRLYQETRLFHHALFDSTLPSYVLDAVSSQASIIRTNTCLRLADGDFFAFEGCSGSIGCCPMNCTHVWNYEQTLAHLFPSLERSMRRTDFLVNTARSGYMAFRTLIPLGRWRWKMKPAADGQMGCIMKLYREWKLRGDGKFLKQLWPQAKKALEFAWKDWDPNEDGVMEGEQHNTYDIEFYGPNTMTGTLYLGALRAAEEMAKALGDEKSAKKYRSVYEKGRRRLDGELWNGQYYIQKYDEDKVTKHQYGKGCLSDQLLGEWFARVVGLGGLLPEVRVRKALGSIFRYNFRRDFYNHPNCQRVYALNDEKGLVLCSWPQGGRPQIPFIYCDEVWTGIEYQVAAHLIYEGMVEEGLSIVKAVRERYDGRRRNPYNEVECGDHYARALASWSVLLALSGYEVNAPEGMLGFAPRLRQENFRCFFSTGSSWGVFSQRVTGKRQKEKIQLLYGELSLKEFRFNWAKAGGPRRPRLVVKKDKEIKEATLERTGDALIVRFVAPLSLAAGESLTLTVDDGKSRRGQKNQSPKHKIDGTTLNK